MDEWAGAQWLIAILVAVRSVLGAARASGAITVREPENKPSLWSRYWSSRIADLALILVLVWGGFF